MVAIIRATTADEKRQPHLRAGGRDARRLERRLPRATMAASSSRRSSAWSASGTLRPHDVRVPGILVDVIVVAPDQMQTTQTPYDPAISGELFRPLDSFRLPALRCRQGDRAARGAGACGRLGGQYRLRHFGQRAAHPDRGRPSRQVTWVIEQGAVGGVPLLDFKFGCASNAEAFVAFALPVHLFSGRRFRLSLLSFLEIDKAKARSTSPACGRPHVTAGAGGFVDITARAKKIVFSGISMRAPSSPSRMASW
jgi:propionate CoA-transferase